MLLCHIPTCYILPKSLIFIILYKETWHCRHPVGNVHFINDFIDCHSQAGKINFFSIMRNVESSQFMWKWDWLQVQGRVECIDPYSCKYYRTIHIPSMLSPYWAKLLWWSGSFLCKISSFLHLLTVKGDIFNWKPKHSWSNKRYHPLVLKVNLFGYFSQLEFMLSFNVFLSSVKGTIKDKNYKHFETEKQNSGNACWLSVQRILAYLQNQIWK
jgi:hypothetical protein